jgi:HD-GYP domain-containing protein (c-di-GMP phosphodiesterase class II)
MKLLHPACHIVVPRQDFSERLNIPLEDTVYSALYKYTKALSIALGYRDLLTRLHSERVLGFSEAIGMRCGLLDKKLGILKIAASFHDIGKIGIPDHILLKPEQFEDAEWEIMKQHPIFGAAIIAATELEGSQQVAQIIRHHHEHYDGSGYPDGLSGENIPVCSRIIAIADAYDAMAETRSYQHSRKHHEVMKILIAETGEKFDPHLIHTFFEVIESSKFKAAEN